MEQRIINNGDSGLIIRNNLNDNFAEIYNRLQQLDGVDSDITTINTTVSNIDGRVSSLETLLGDVNSILENI